MTDSTTDREGLARVVRVPGAVLLGLGSILGTGIFVSIGIAAGVAGPSVVIAVALAALVATFNGLSSAQLAANHPVSGGTYEYGYRYLNPSLGFVAGWMFLWAKSASAATAALGCAGYVLGTFGRAGGSVQVALALGVLGAVTAVVIGGMRRSNRANAVIVGITLLALATFVVAAAPAALEGIARVDLIPSGANSGRDFFGGTALLFVAYTGYGRIATLGEEVETPEKSIPRAIVITLGVTMLIYVSVTFVAVAAVGADRLAEATRGGAAPLERVASALSIPGIGWAVALGAITAMVGVLLNLVLGLSRVALAMARRGDLPRGLSHVEGGDPSPRRAVLVVSAVIGLLALFGSVEITWSFSAFTVLVYYALTNLAALRLPAAARLYPRWVSWAGLVCCLALAVWVDARTLLVGTTLIALGLSWHVSVRRRAH